MNRISVGVEKCVSIEPSVPKVIPAGQSILVLDDVTKSIGEWSARYVQNVGAGDCYYSVGVDCSPTTFNGVLAGAASVDANGYGAGSQYNATEHPKAVYVYSVAGTKIATTVLKRNEMGQGTGNILN